MGGARPDAGRLCAFMLFVMTGFWLVVMVFLAHGAQRLWTHLVRPRWVNIALLPGTALVQLGSIATTLLTGQTVRDAALFAGEDGEPRQGSGGPARFPRLAGMLEAVTPTVLCLVAIGLAARYVGGKGIAPLFAGSLEKTAPLSVAAFWRMVHDQVSLMQQTLDGLARCDPRQWRVLVFVYLLVCLSVRAAPAGERFRPLIVAIAVLTVAAGLAATLFGSVSHYMERGWPLLSLVVGTLSLLLVATLLIRSGVALAKIISGRT